MKEHVFQGLDCRNYSLLTMKEVDSLAFSRLFEQCAGTISHMTIHDEKLTISFGHTSIFQSSHRDEPVVMNMYQGCLYNLALPVKVENDRQKVCGNMGLHYQLHSSLHRWIHDFVIEMAGFMNSSVQKSASVGLSKKEMLKSLEIQLNQMSAFRILESSARQKVVQSILLAAQNSTKIFDYQPIQSMSKDVKVRARK